MRWIRQVSLRLQIIGLVLSFTLAVGLGNAFRAHLALDDMAREQFERRSVATALALAAQATDLSLANDLFGLFELLNNTLVSTPDVRYIMVLDENGTVRAHTFGPGVPRGLDQANHVPPGEPWHMTRLSTEEGPVVDIAAPLLEGQPGTLRLGMSEQAILDSVNRHTVQLVGLMALSLAPVLIITYFLGRTLTTPLLKLVDVTNAIRQGDLTRRVPVQGRDEVARLGAAFNEMTQALAESQIALEASNRNLQSRNEELAALYAVATAIANAGTVDELANAALTKSLEVMGFEAGWVFLIPHAGETPSLRAERGLPPQQAQHLAHGLPGCCLPFEAQHLQTATLVHPGQPCPCLTDTEACAADLITHMAVPLRSRTTMWGTMHLAAKTPDEFTPANQKLLTAMGRQIGMAVENAFLSETQRREAFRQVLFERTLTAQEEERKRIARELHDELAQSLAVLIRDLEDVAHPKLHGQNGWQARVQDTRALAVQILEQTRRLIFDLRPSALDDLGLLPALRRYARHHLEPAGIEMQFTVSGAKHRLPSNIETAVFRIGQEAISNVVKHSAAGQVQINLGFESRQVTLTVSDNGKGFEPAQTLDVTANPANGLGLLGMQERAKLLNGTLIINSKPGAGTSVQATIPLEDSP